MYETEQITTSWLYTTSGDRENWRSLQHCIRHTLNAAQSKICGIDSGPFAHDDKLFVYNL